MLRGVYSIYMPPLVERIYHGVLDLIPGVIKVNTDDSDERRLEALVHELIHDGLVRTGTSMTHDSVRTAAHALARSITARSE